MGYLYNYIVDYIVLYMAANSAATNWKAEFAKMQELHAEAVAWSTHAFHLQVNNTMRFWRTMLDMEG